MYLLPGDEMTQRAVNELQEKTNVKLSRKEQRRLAHYLTMKKVQSMSNGRFFNKPRAPVLSKWLFERFLPKKKGTSESIYIAGKGGI